MNYGNRAPWRFAVCGWMRGAMCRASWTSSSGLGAHLDLRRGQRIRNEENGRAYLVGDRVGQGGFGVVYRAEQASGDPLDRQRVVLEGLRGRFVMAL